MMVVLDTLFKESSMTGVDDNIVCMPHRGRLNLLTGILRLNPSAIFSKIKGKSGYRKLIG
jgi:probable 2-oxoglutarate dehydrogenase E1 component DHKTD1